MMVETFSKFSGLLDFIDFSQINIGEIFENFFVSKPWLKEKVNFFRLLAVTQNAGLGLRDALVSIKESEKHAWMKRILNGLIEKVNAWLPLSEAMSDYWYFFSPSEIALVRSSETMWNMPEVLQNMADELESFAKLRWRIKSAMMYPTVVILFAIGAVLILLRKVVPTIVDLFPSKDKLPEITKFVLAMSDFVKGYWYILLLSIIGVIVWFIFLYKTVEMFKMVVDKFLIQAPVIWDLVRKYNYYRFSKMLWDFYNAWVSLPEALAQISDVLGNYWYKNKVLDIKKDIEVWLWFLESIEGSWLFEPILVQVIWIWEKTWNLGDVLLKMSSFYKDELNSKIEWLTKLIEPFLMAFVAILIWFIAASVFLPMADLIWQIWNS